MKEGLIAGVILMALMAIVGVLGYAGGRNSVKVEQFAEYKAAVQAREVLQKEVNASDLALQKKQNEVNEARSKKVVEKVTVYRDRIKEVRISQCVKESGILDLYDESMK